MSLVHSHGGSIFDFAHAGGSSLESWKIANCTSSFALTTGALTINVLRAFPFIAPRRGGALDRLGYEVTTGVLGNGRIGLYTNRGEADLYPDALLDDSGSIANSIAFKSFTVARGLVPGQMYWLAHVADTAVTLRSMAIASCSHILGSPAGGGAALNAGLSVAFTYAALPATFTAGGAYITAVPLPALYYRFVA